MCDFIICPVCNTDQSSNFSKCAHCDFDFEEYGTILNTEGKEAGQSYLEQERKKVFVEE